MTYDVTIYDVEFKSLGLNRAMFIDKEDTRGYVFCKSVGIDDDYKWGGNHCDIIQCEEDEKIKDFSCSRINDIFAVFLDGDKLERKREKKDIKILDEDNIFCLTNENLPKCLL